MQNKWLMFLELLVVLAFLIGWGVLEWVAARMDRRKKQEAQRAETRSDDAA